MSTFKLEIVTPTRILDEGAVSYVRCPGMDGSFGVMKDHTSAIIALDVGEIKITREKREFFLATGGGVADIQGDKVLLLVESAENAEEIDISRAEKAAQKAKERLKEHSGIDINRALAALSRALNRLKVAKR